jgi:RimJ/RimL family protein N-acetyltransferase
MSPAPAADGPHDPQDHHDADRAFAHERVLDAPREHVFETLTDPARLALWWGPSGFTNRFELCEPRSGGRWRFTMRAPDGAEFANESVFTQVAAPERVVIDHFSGHHFTLTITLADAGGGRTRLRWRQVFDSAQEKQRIAAFVPPANEQNLDRLAAVVRGGVATQLTARLALRPLADSDTAFIVALLNDADWLRFIGDRGVRTPEAARAWLRDGPTAHGERHGFALQAVERLDRGVAIGICGLIRREGLADVDLGYALLPAHRGHGFVREAAAAWLERGFARHGLSRIAAYVKPGNAASLRVLQALGLSADGVCRLPGQNEDSLRWTLARA